MSISIVSIIITYLIFGTRVLFIQNVKNCSLETVFVVGGTLYFAIGIPYLIECKFIYILR